MATPITSDPNERSWSAAGGVGRPCYILDLVTNNSLALQYIPQEIEYNPDAGWAVIKSFGRNAPFYHYTGSEDILKFTLHWVAAQADKQDVMLKTKWLESLSKSDGYDSDPHPCKFIFGEVWKKATWIVYSASPKYSLFDGANNMFPTFATQDVELRRITSKKSFKNRNIKSIYLMSDVVIDIPVNCPYGNGIIIDFGDGTLSLQMTGFVYTPTLRDPYYTLVDGDTLSNLANDNYGDSKWWFVLAIANNIINPFLLITGTTIVIPDLEVVKLALQ